VTANDTLPTDTTSGAARPEGALLGSITKSASEIHRRTDRTVKYALQAAARELHPDNRIRSCMLALAPNKSRVEVWCNSSEKRAFYRGLIRCNQLWICPVCAAWITERRRISLTALLSVRDNVGRVDDEGRTYDLYVPRWHVALATFTVAHNMRESLVTVKKRLDTAYRYQWSGRWAIAWRAKHRVIGTIRALEITHGDNGWHPHYHTLLVRDSANTPLDIALMELELRDRWGDAVSAAYGTVSREHGVTFGAWDAGAVAYVSKLGQQISTVAKRWNVVSELTKAPAKRGRRAGRTTWELLADYLTGDVGAGELWITAAWALKGCRHLVASPGLYDTLGATKDLDSDTTAIEYDESIGERLMASLSADQWRIIIRKHIRGDLLDVADSGDQSKVNDFLREILG
jgi:hypothetical protein